MYVVHSEVGKRCLVKPVLKDISVNYAYHKRSSGVRSSPHPDTKDPLITTSSKVYRLPILC